MRIKAKMLPPQELDEQGNEMIPQELIDKLLEYKRIRGCVPSPKWRLSDAEVKGAISRRSFLYRRGRRGYEIQAITRSN